MSRPPVKCMIISPRSQWEEYICPCCDELMDNPVITSCGHRMCYKCFVRRRMKISTDTGFLQMFDHPRCPVRDDDGQGHKMSRWKYSKDWTAECEIDNLLVKCDKCKVECTVKRYRSFSCSIAHEGINSILISSRSQWEECICPDCDELMDDPVLTSCGHHMCYKCFYKRRLWSFDPWCPVRDDDGQEHKMSRWRYSEDRTAECKINKFLVKCDKCKVECTVKRFRKFDCSIAHDAGINSIVISPRSQWQEHICPECDELMNDPVLTSCGHWMCYKCFEKRKSFDSWCPVRDDDGQEHKMSQWKYRKDKTAKWKINKLLVKCEKCKVECTVKRYRKFDCSIAHDPGIKSILISPRSQWEEYICPDCDELMDDPVLTSCGHQMCHKCFDKRKRRSCDHPWCPVRDDDGCRHQMSRWKYSKDWTAEWEINKLLVKCDKCKVECTVKRYRSFSCSTAHKGINSILISPRSQWQEYICPDCDELMNDPVLTSCGHWMCYKCFEKRKSFDSWCPVRDDDGQEHKMSQDDWSKDRTAEWKINKLLVKCDKCKVECTVKRYRKFDCSTAHAEIKSILISPRSQWEEYICPDCDELMYDPVQTCCGHRLCFKCFNNRRENFQDRWCPVRDDDDDDDERHEMTWDHWCKDKAIRKKINKLLVKCADCGVVCTVKEYKKFHSTSIITEMLSQGEVDGLCRFLLNDCKEDLPHWKQLLQDNEVVTQSQFGVTNNELFSKVLPNRECTGIMAFHQCLKRCSCPRCKHLLRLWSDLSVADYDEVPTSDPQQRNRLTADAVYTKLASIKMFHELEKFPPDQQQKLITQVLKETLPAAKGSLSIDQIHPLLYQNGVITSEEAKDLLGIFTAEEKVKRLYTKMSPNEGLKGLKKFMRILYDTGWKTPSHMRHHGELSIKLSEKLSRITSASAESDEAAREEIIPMVYSESLPDAVINLSMNINKLLLVMLKKHIVSTSDYCWLRGACYHGRKLEYLYKEILPQKGVKELKAFMEILQEVGRKTPKYHNHHDLLKSTLQTHLSKF